MTSLVVSGHTVTSDSPPVELQYKPQPKWALRDSDHGAGIYENGDDQSDGRSRLRYHDTAAAARIHQLPALILTTAAAFYLNTYYLYYKYYVRNHSSTFHVPSSPTTVYKLSINESGVGGGNSWTKRATTFILPWPVPVIRPRARPFPEWLPPAVLSATVAVSRVPLRVDGTSSRPCPADIRNPFSFIAPKFCAFRVSFGHRYSRRWQPDCLHCATCRLSNFLLCIELLRFALIADTMAIVVILCFLVFFLCNHQLSQHRRETSTITALLTSECLNLIYVPSSL